MTDSSSRIFGLIIAYLVPGFIALVGMTPLVPSVGGWLQPVAQGDLGFGPPIYAIIAAMGAGLIVSCFRWLLIDQLHHWMGVRRPALRYERTEEVLSSLDYLVQTHFRYYEFTGNMLVAGLWAYVLHRLANTLPLLGPGTDLGMVILVAVLFAAGRDALSNYYLQSAQLVGSIAAKGQRGELMFNGKHHEDGSGEAPKKAPTPNKSEKPEANAKPAVKEQGDASSGSGGKSKPKS